MKLDERMKRWVHLLWLAAILTDIVASLLPADSLPIRTLEKLALSDKIEHMAMYAVVAMLPAIFERGHLVAVAALGAVALGIGLEYAQLFSGWRDFEYGDMLASAVGVMVGLAAGIFVRTMLCRRARKPEGPFARKGLVPEARGLKLP